MCHVGDGKDRHADVDGTRDQSAYGGRDRQDENPRSYRDLHGFRQEQVEGSIARASYFSSSIIECFYILDRKAKGRLKCFGDISPKFQIFLLYSILWPVISPPLILYRDLVDYDSKRLECVYILYVQDVLHVTVLRWLSGVGFSSRG